MRTHLGTSDEFTGVGLSATSEGFACKGSTNWSGSARDATGSVVPVEHVESVDGATGRQATCNEDQLGYYTFPRVPQAWHEFVAKHEGLIQASIGSANLSVQHTSMHTVVVEELESIPGMVHLGVPAPGLRPSLVCLFYRHASEMGVH